MAEKQKTPLGPMGSTLTENVRRLREAQRLTYVELSDRLTEAGRPIPVLGLRRIERGERRVDVDDLIALALVFNVSPGSLLLPHEKPAGDPSDPHEHWLPLTDSKSVDWEAAWRWMHGEYPPAEVSRREVQEFRRENRPYENTSLVHEVYAMIRVRMDGAWDLTMSGDESGSMSGRLTARVEKTPE
ncbi:helix-turn-helix domain-containing protein [Streptomyces goshikiensis]|uniref:helix-turn-helix domain-containing protein n=1 Tax=Streptomyces goshikiensis TaxID=1942 RepID=UPI003688850D